MPSTISLASITAKRIQLNRAGRLATQLSATRPRRVAGANVSFLSGEAAKRVGEMQRAAFRGG